MEYTRCSYVCFFEYLLPIQDTCLIELLITCIVIPTNSYGKRDYCIYRFTRL